MAALLGDDAILSPRSQSVVESFVGRSDGFFLWRGQTSLVEFRQVAHPEIGTDNHPGITASAHGVREPAAVLKNEIRVSAGSRFHRVPIDGVVQVDVKIRDHRLAVDSHVCRRRHKGLFYILHLFNQRLLRRTTLTGTQLYSAFVHHDGEREARMLFGFRHHRQRCLVGERIAKSIPVDDHTLNAAANHVRDLTVDLRGILRAVPDVHMARIAKPRHQMRVHLAARTRIQERMDVQFAGVAHAHISIALQLKGTCRTSIVGGFGLKSGSRNYIEVSGC